MDGFESLDRTRSEFDRRLRAVEPGEWSLETPCAGWTVRDLVNHVVGGNRMAGSLLALGTRIATKAAQRNINTVTTNVPGPQHRLYVLGRRMLTALPYVPLGAQCRIAVAIFSYDGQVNFGVTGDYDTAPDLDVLCQGIEHGMAELGTLAGSASAAS
jgi:diacylglycerol O-acyltransferase / wax synthase